MVLEDLLMSTDINHYYYSIPDQSKVKGQAMYNLNYITKQKHFNVSFHYYLLCLVEPYHFSSRLLNCVLME